MKFVELTGRENFRINSILATTDILVHLNIWASTYGEIKSRLSLLTKLP